MGVNGPVQWYGLPPLGSHEAIARDVGWVELPLAACSALSTCCSPCTTSFLITSSSSHSFSATTTADYPPSFLPSVCRIGKAVSRSVLPAARQSAISAFQIGNPSGAPIRWLPSSRFLSRPSSIPSSASRLLLRHPTESDPIGCRPLSHWFSFQLLSRPQP